MLFEEVLPFLLGSQRAVFEALAGLSDEFLQGGEIPYLDSAVVGGGGEVAAIGAEGGGEDVAVVCRNRV